MFLKYLKKYPTHVPQTIEKEGGPPSHVFQMFEKDGGEPQPVAELLKLFSIVKAKPRKAIMQLTFTLPFKCNNIQRFVHLQVHPLQVQQYTTFCASVRAYFHINTLTVLTRILRQALSEEAQCTLLAFKYISVAAESNAHVIENAYQLCKKMRNCKTFSNIPHHSIEGLEQVV